MEMIAADTDRAEASRKRAADWDDRLPTADALHLSLKRPQEYREQGRTNLDWLSHRWLYNIPRSLETRGYRPLGRLAFVDHLEKVLSLIDRKLEKLAPIRAGDSGDPDQQRPADIRIVLLAGMGGGTGSGMAIDLANAARSRVQASGRQAQVQGVFLCTCLGSTSASPLSIANTYSLLIELQFVSVFGNHAANDESNPLQPFESRQRPFDQVYCVPFKSRADDGLDLIARQMSLASTDGVRQMLHCCQQAPTPREQGGRLPLLLRTFGSSPLIDEGESAAADSRFGARNTDQIVEVDGVAAGETTVERNLAAVDIDTKPAIQTDLRQALARADVDLLQCGFDRRTLIVVPSGACPFDTIDAATNARPTAAIIPANVKESSVYCEGSGINPSAFARGLERVYPGIAEAASRLFTRIDIDWSAWTL